MQVNKRISYNETTSGKAMLQSCKAMSQHREAMSERREANEGFNAGAPVKLNWMESALASA